MERFTEEANKIIGHEWRLVNGRPKLYYIISSEGFSSENHTCEPEENLNSCSEPLALYKDYLKTLARTLCSEPREKWKAKITL
jgi:hypothetical protein